LSRENGPRMLICITGLPGSGKSTVAALLARRSLPVVVMGDEVREEARRRGIPLDGPSLRRFMVEIRGEGGPGVVAELCMRRIDTLVPGPVVVDGLRSVEELEAFRRRYGRTVLLEVRAPAELRLERMRGRAREDTPRSLDSFLERDRAELAVGLGELLGRVDYVVVNDGTRDELGTRVEALLRGLGLEASA